MSILAALFGFTRLPPWLIELVVILGLGLSGYVYHRHVIHVAIATGISQQQAADRDATHDLNAETDKQSALNLALATKAAADANEELDAIKRYVASHARAGSVCQQPATYPRSQVVPEGGSAHAGKAGAGPSPAVVQPVQPGDPGSPGRSQRELLTALAAVSDTVSAALREEQTIRSHP